MSAYIFDAESTGFNEGVIIEEAHASAGFIGGAFYYGPTTSELFNPMKPIEFGAMAVHHILDEDLVDYRPHTEFALPDDTEYLIGHNIDYDWELIGKPDVKRICTLAIVRAMWPEADHNQMAMAYMLCPELARKYAGKAHRAGIDVLILSEVLSEIIRYRMGDIKSMEKLYLFSEEARVPKVMAVGKHKGVRMADLPKDYIGWFLRQPEVDKYLRKALEAAY